METDYDKSKLLSEKRSRSGRVKYFSGRASVGLGSTMITCGCLAIIAQIVVLVVYNQFFNSISQGIWCGVAFLFCGIIGVVAGKRRTIPWIMTHLVLCIIVCFFAVAIIGLSALTSITNFDSLYTYQHTPCRNNNMDNGYYSGDYYNNNNNPMGDTGSWGYAATTSSYWYWNNNPNNYGSYNYRQSSPCYSYGRYVINVPWVVQFSMNMLMGLLGILSAIIAIIAATLSCAPLCCNPDKEEKETYSALSTSPSMTNVCIVPQEPPKTELLINMDAPTDVIHI